MKVSQMVGDGGRETVSSMPVKGQGHYVKSKPSKTKANEDQETEAKSKDSVF